MMTFSNLVVLVLSLLSLAVAGVAISMVYLAEQDIRDARRRLDRIHASMRERGWSDHD